MHRIAPLVIFSLITGLPFIFDFKEIAFRFGRRHSTIRYSSPLNPIAYSLSSCFHSTLENFDDRTRAHVKRTLLLKRVENRHARTCASVPVRRNRVSILCSFSLSVKSSRCHTSSFSHSPSLSPLLYPFSISFSLSVTQEFSRVSSFCPTCLPSGTQEVQHRDPDICPPLSPPPKTTSCLLDIFLFLASFRFSFPRNLIDLSSLRITSLILSRSIKSIYKFLYTSKDIYYTM